MIQLDPTVGAASALALSAAVYVAARRVRRTRASARRAETRLPELPDFPVGLAVAPVEVVPAQRVEVGAAALAVLDPSSGSLVVPLAPLAEPAVEGQRATVKVRRVAPATKARTPRPVAPVAVEAANPSALSEEQRSELLSLIETMQWDRALACVQRLAAGGCDLAVLAAVAEEAALERVRALPEFEAHVGFGGYRVLAALAPENGLYATKVAEHQNALSGRRAALLDKLTRDEDRFEPGTVWFNHPYNPAFDDIRLPVWLYIGRKDDGLPWLRLRTNWLGETRISVQGIEVIHDGMTETLTDGHYKIDADALGWEWRDEAVSVYQLELLRSLVGAESVTLRYKGDPYAVEVELTSEEKAAVAEMIELYDLMRMAAAAPQPAMAA